MANLTAEQYDTLQEMLKVITEARQTSERLSESWAKGLVNPIGPHTNHQSLQTQENVTIPEESVIPDPFIEPLEHELVSQVGGPISDVLLVQKVDSHVMEVEESPQQSTNSNDKNVAHQVFAEMPLGVTSKEKQRKSLKAWKFKFKASFKRSKLMDDMFSAVEETVLLNKDLKETIWDFVKKEFKETRAACGKKITDRFKVVDETTKPAAYDGKFQIRVWDCGGSLLECVWWRRLKHCQRYCHEMQAIEAENKSPETLGDHPFAPMKPCQSYAQPCLKCEAEMTIPLVKETQDRIVNEWFKVQVFSDFDVASWIGLEIYGCETKKHMLLCVNLANRVWERGELLATHLYWELFGLKALIGLEIYKWKCKQLPIASNFRINHPHELADLVLKRALTEQDTSLPRADWRTKNSVPFVMQCMAVQEMVLMQAHETITKTDSGQAHEFQGTIVPNLAPDFVIQLHQIRSSIFQEVHEALWLALPISTANQKKDLHRKNYMIQWSWHCVKHESQQTDFHVWHRWKNKAANLHAIYAISELMMLRLVSFQPNKGDDVVGLVPKATVLREVSHCQSNDYGTIRHKLLLVRDTSSDGYKEDSWSFIWFILKELRSAGYEWENETIKKSFKELSKQERYHKLLFPKNQKLLNLEAGFCTQYNDLERLNTEHQSSPGLDYFTYLNFIWKQVFNCGCEAGHISYGFSSVGDVHEFFICSKFRNGDETYGKRLLGLNEISLLDNDNKVDFTIKANWFYNKPMIREVFHLQRPPELIYLQGNPNFITKVLVQWKEHPPDQLFSGFYGQVLMLSSLRTRMFRRREYCYRMLLSSWFNIGLIMVY